MARITAGQIGRRVSVRRRTASGAATDVVGDLVGWTPDTLTVRDRDDVEHQIPRRAVVAARIVRAAPVRPAVADLERIAARGWPATETAHLGDWLLRAAGGFTGRANTVLAVGDPGMPLASAAAAVRAWYAERGLPAGAAVVLPSPEDDALAAAGWSTGPAVLVQTAAVEAVADGAPADERVQVSRSPSTGWLARYTARGQVDDAARRVLTGGGTVGFAQIDSEPAATGKGAQGGSEPAAIGEGTQPDNEPAATGHGGQPDSQPAATGHGGQGGQSDTGPAATGHGSQPDSQPAATGHGRQGGQSDTGPAATGQGAHGGTEAAAIGQGGSEPAAIGRGVVVDGWLGIAAVEVAPDARRRGLATAVTRALARWGAEHGASRVYLQVQTDNTAARELYAALGFRTHHRYRYRTAPPA